MTILRCKLKSKLFEGFDCARCAKDVTLHRSSQSTENVAERKVYFFGKQKLYGCKVERPVLPFELGIGCTPHYSASSAVLENFRENKALHRKTSEEVIRDLAYDDSDVLQHYSSD